jgi:hypothetical protein
MSQMMRKQIYIQKRQQALLRRLARARGVSEAELIRQAIDRETSAGSAPAHTDASALDEIVRFALARRKQGVVGKSYRWKRTDAYEERLSRYDRPK